MTVKYDKTGKGWGRGDIYYACEARRGNCTDFHAIFIGYARAMGIPARFAIGFPLPADRGAGQIAGYHCWAEFYAKGIGWVPVDASEAAKNPAKREYFFGAHDENRDRVFERPRCGAHAPPARRAVELLCLSIRGSGRKAARWNGTDCDVSRRGSCAVIGSEPAGRARDYPIK